MSPRKTEPVRVAHPEQARMFAALGDETRLALVTRLGTRLGARLGSGREASIAELTQGSRLTRQAVTKHLKVLEKAGFVRCRRQGRESLFVLNPRPIDEMQAYLGSVSREWDRALARLKALVED